MKKLEQGWLYFGTEKPVRVTNVEITFTPRGATAAQRRTNKNVRRKSRVRLPGGEP